MGEVSRVEGPPCATRWMCVRVRRREGRERATPISLGRFPRRHSIRGGLCLRRAGGGMAGVVEACGDWAAHEALCLSAPSLSVSLPPPSGFQSRPLAPRSCARYGGRRGRGRCVSSARCCRPFPSWTGPGGRRRGAPRRICVRWGGGGASPARPGRAYGLGACGRGRRSHQPRICVRGVARGAARLPASGPARAGRLPVDEQITMGPGPPGRRHAERRGPLAPGPAAKAPSWRGGRGPGQ